ncbi:hypothetical protein Tco_0290601 [Tanacetum coccineum]
MMTNMIVTTPVNVTGAPVTNTVTNHAEKPEKFNRHNFKRWQQRMFFYLRILNLARFLNETAPHVEPPKEVENGERMNLGKTLQLLISGKRSCDSPGKEFKLPTRLYGGDGDS